MDYGYFLMDNVDDRRESSPLSFPNDQPAGYLCDVVKHLQIKESSVSLRHIDLAENLAALQLILCDGTVAERA